MITGERRIKKIILTRRAVVSIVSSQDPSATPTSAVEKEILQIGSLYYYSPHLIERDIRAVLGATDVSYSTLGYVSVWTQWKRKKHGLPYTWTDLRLAVEAGKLARAALNHGILMTSGASEKRLIWLANPGEHLYEPNSAGGGRLRLPTRKRGAGRMSMDGRHAEIVGPIALRLIADLAEHSGSSPIPDEWRIVNRKFPAVKDFTINQARNMLSEVHNDESISTQIEWLFQLRSTLVRSERSRAMHELSDGDLEALQSLI